MSRNQNELSKESYDERMMNGRSDEEMDECTSESTNERNSNLNKCKSQLAVNINLNE